MQIHGITQLRGCGAHSTGQPDGTATQSRRCFLKSTAGLLAWGAASGIQSAASAAVPLLSNATRLARDEAVRQMPLRMLAEPVRSKIQAVIERPTLFRRIPPQLFVCEPDLYLFLIRYPEVVVNMWQLMGITRVKLKRTGQFMFDAADGAGTTSRIELVYGTREQHLLLAEGFYDGPLVPRRVTGRCVLLLSTAYSQNEQEQKMVSHRLDVFVQIDNLGIEVIAKTLHPLLGKTADNNFVESTKFLSQISRVVESNGPGVQRLATRLTSIDPAVRQKFADLASEINHEAILREAHMTDSRAANGRLADSSDENDVKSIVDSEVSQSASRTKR